MTERKYKEEIKIIIIITTIMFVCWRSTDRDQYRNAEMIKYKKL